MSPCGTNLLRIFDYFTAMLTGLLASLMVAWIVSPEWSMMGGMVVGMILGIVALLSVMLTLGWVAGSFEILMPGKIIVMIVGMGGGMAESMNDLPLGALAAFGVATGLIVGALFHLYDRSLHGEAGSTLLQTGGEK